MKRQTYAQYYGFDKEVPGHQAQASAQTAAHGQDRAATPIPSWLELEAQLAETTAQRDELLAALRLLLPLAVAGLSQAPTHDGLVNAEALVQARDAIARAEVKP